MSLPVDIIVFGFFNRYFRLFLPVNIIVLAFSTGIFDCFYLLDFLLHHISTDNKRILSLLKSNKSAIPTGLVAIFILLKSLKCSYLFFQQTKYIRNQISVRYGMIHTNRYRHHQSAIFFPISPPVNNWQKIKKSISEPFCREFQGSRPQCYCCQRFFRRNREPYKCI